jgi:hypothetical protein
VRKVKSLFVSYSSEGSGRGLYYSIKDSTGTEGRNRLFVSYTRKFINKIKIGVTSHRQEDYLVLLSHEPLLSETITIEVMMFLTHRRGMMRHFH